MSKIDVGDLTNLFFTKGILSHFTYPVIDGLTHVHGFYNYEGKCNIYMSGSVTQDITLNFPTPKLINQLPIKLNETYKIIDFNGTIALKQNDIFEIIFSYEV